MSLKNRSFLKLLDYTPAEMEELLDLAADLKAKKKAGIRHNDQLAGKNIALIFEKTSTRTRCSFEVAAHDLGMEVTYLDPSGSQIGKKESIADTARVLGRMFDGIEYRGYGQQIVEDLARYAGVPVWNGLTNEFHPTQILADFLTIREHFGHLKGIHFVYFGDARYNMGNSLMVGCAKMGLHFIGDDRIWNFTWYDVLFCEYRYRDFPDCSKQTWYEDCDGAYCGKKNRGTDQCSDAVYRHGYDDLCQPESGGRRI